MPEQLHLDKLNEGVQPWNKWRKKHTEILPDLRNADLHGKVLNGINFQHTNLDGVNLQASDLCTALLDFASLYKANLSGARLRSAHLYKTYLKETVLRHTDFHRALLLDTMFLNVDLSETKHLETVFHLGPSTIGVDTIQRSKGKIHDVFLREAGVLEQLIANIRASGIAPFDYYTCFISYSNLDRQFVDKLYQDLRKEGVPCWYALESLKAGDKFQAHITEAVQSREKVLVVLSKYSIKSSWVGKEVELARRKEGNGKDVLVPIWLDNAIATTKIDWAVAIRDKRHISGFENWQRSSKYQETLKGLLEALRKP